MTGEVAPEKPLQSFSGMGEDFDDLANQILGTQPVAAVAASPLAVPPQPVPPAPGQPVVPPAPAQAVPPEGQPAVPAPAAPPQPGATQPSDPVDAVLAEMQAQEKAIFDKILPAFAITPELAAELEADAITATPKLLAKTFMSSVSTSLRYMQQIVPGMIAREIARSTAARTVEDAFFGQFKKLDREKHGADVISFANAFRQKNPQITREALFSQVGAAVMAMHGITPEAAAAAVAAVTGQAPAIAVPQAPAPFSPALGGSVVASSPVAPPNGFVGMGNDYD